MNRTLGRFIEIFFWIYLVVEISVGISDTQGTIGLIPVNFLGLVIVSYIFTIPSIQLISAFI